MIKALTCLTATSLLVAGCSADETAGNAVQNTVMADEALVDASETGAETSEMEVCDDAGNRYASDAEAEAAGLVPAQYGATYCPEYLAGASGMHPSWDANEDGINDCEDEGSCDDSVDYSQPRP